MTPSLTSFNPVKASSLARNDLLLCNLKVHDPVQPIITLASLPDQIRKSTMDLVLDCPPQLWIMQGGSTDPNKGWQ